MKHIAFALALTLCLSLAANANTFTVVNTNDSGPGSLRAALASAANGDTINFCVHGTITLTSGELVIATNVTIIGPGQANLAISGNGLFTVLQVNSGVTASIASLTIENGYAGLAAGGGIDNQGTLTVSYSIVTENIGPVEAGGIYNGGTLTVSNSTVSNNRHETVGGTGEGIYNTGTATILNSVITGNQNNDGGLGGGIYSTGTMTISNSSVSENFAVSGNCAGIFNGGTMNIGNSTISGNFAGGGNGGGICNAGTLTVTDSTLSGNSDSGGYGGAISNGGPLTVLNSTFSGNSAFNGGAIGAPFSGTIIISNSTFTGNSSDNNEGGAIYAPGGTMLVLKSTLLAGQTSGGNCFYVGSSPTSDGYNLSDDGSCGFLTNTGDQNNVTTADLSPSGLQNNGGPTQTIALLSTSSAIDAIPPASCTDASGNPVLTDQRGVARPQGSGCDIGAFEFVPFVSPNNLSFGNVKLGHGPHAVVTLTDTGTTSFTIGTISFVNVSGNPVDFTFHRYCGSGLLPGHSCTIAIRFSPSESATETATLNIVTSLPGSPLQVPVAGTGIQ